MIHIGERIRTGLAFDDVLLVPQRTSLDSRKEALTASTLSSSIRLGVPIISANTQWCTGARMAAAIAYVGGLGFVHRMQTIDQQTAQVAEVKHAAVSDAGASVAADGTLLVGAAVGVRGDYEERARRLRDAGADLLLVDVAHGHADYAIEALSRLRKLCSGTTLVAGNVATSSGARDLIEAGADIIKVGVGPGGVCTTRLVAGSGVPQLTAIMDCAEEARRHDVTVIADGGIRQSGDIAKALAAGAAAVMLGSRLAGCDESEALPVEHEDHRYKISRGFATLGMSLTLRQASGEQITREEVNDYVPEGVEATFPATGPLAENVRQLAGGLQSAMSYSGARTLAEFAERAEFIRVTPAGQVENQPHVVLGGVPQLAPDYRAGAGK